MTRRSGTGHLLLATLDARDRARRPHRGQRRDGLRTDATTASPRTLTRALPGGEHSTGEVDGGGVISFDLLIRILANWFREQLPPGWVMHASGRSGGFRLRVPNSRSEEDHAINMGWIVTSDQSGRDRLLEVTQTALAELQTGGRQDNLYAAGHPARATSISPNRMPRSPATPSTQSFACSTDRRTHLSSSSSHESCSTWSSNG